MRPLGEANPHLLRYLKTRRDTFKDKRSPIGRYLELKRGEVCDQAAE